MFTKSIFAPLAAICLVAQTFLAPDSGAPGGGGAPAPAPAAPPQSLEDRLAKATTDLATQSAEVTRLTLALSEAGRLATQERENLQQQFTQATAAATTAQTDLATARGEVTRLTTELATANSSLARATGNVTRLETLCDLKGIDRNQAIVVPSAPGAGSGGALETAEDYNVKLAAAKTPEAQEQVLKDFEAAVSAGKVKKTASLG